MVRIININLKTKIMKNHKLTNTITKNIFTLLVLGLMTSYFAHATEKIENLNSLDPTEETCYGNDINILSIKADIDSNKRAYFMTGSFTVIKNPKSNSDVAHTVDISFRNSLILSRRGSNYIQANAKAKRNDNNSINEFRIYVHHDNRGQGKIDKRNIKINWKTGSLEVVNKLTNVSIIYQKDSILITGTMQKNGYTIGVSLAISKETRLI